MNRAARRVIFGPCLALGVLGPSWASAEEPASAPERALEPRLDATAEARRLGHEGLTAYSNGEFGEALRLFGRAEELVHSPVFQLYMARCLAELGRTEEARALLTAVADEPDDANAPPAWRRAREEARAELPELPQVTASPRVGDPTKDPLAELPPRRVSASVEGTAPAASAASPAPSSSSSASGLTREEWGALAAYSAGGAGLVVAIVAGSLAVSRANEVKDNCIGSSCRPEDEAKAHEARLLANVATAGVVTALVGAGVGTTLLFLGSARNDDTTEVAVSIGAGRLDIVGRF